MNKGEGSHAKPTHDDISGRHGPSPLVPEPPDNITNPLPAETEIHGSLPNAALCEKTPEELIVEHYKMTAEAARAGEAPAFQELVRRIEPWMKTPIRSFARLVDLDEITQESLIHLFDQAPAVRALNDRDRHPRRHDKNAACRHTEPPAEASEGDLAGGEVTANDGRFDPNRGVSFKSWFSRHLINRALTKVAAQKRHLDQDRLLRRAEECSTDMDLHVFIEELLASLTEKEAYVAREHAAGRTFESIGRELHVTTGAAYKTYRSAVAKMRARSER